MIAALLLIALVGLFVVGVASNAPAALIVAILCALPGFASFLGAALGRASNEFSIVKNKPDRATAARVTTQRQTPLS